MSWKGFLLPKTVDNNTFLSSFFFFARPLMRLFLPQNLFQSIQQLFPFLVYFYFSLPQYST